MGDDAFERALEAHGRKERTQAELADWLTARGFESEDVTGTIERLVELGELDDARFARRYAEDKRELRGWGPERIREALEARGIAGTEIDAALSADHRDDQLKRAVELLERRGATLGDDTGRSRALAFLTRRGYDHELAYEAVRRSQRRAA
ncbi:MAG TPA: regulatory protein RecX [Solirubrobacterales bacterium]|nr:regulatory protein RecX [Solirubrobacterales bacterium]